MAAPPASARRAPASTESPAAVTMALHPSRTAGVRLATRVLGKAALALFGVGSFEDAAVEALVRAPNAGMRARAPAAGEHAIVVGTPPVTLSMAFVGPVSSQGTLFFLHGIRDSKEALLGWAHAMANLGYRSVLVDSRGHGHSTGDILSYGIQESKDLVQVLDALERDGLARGPIGVMGHSYGAATAIEWAARDARVRAVVGVAPFASLQEVVVSVTRRFASRRAIDRMLERAAEHGGFAVGDACAADAIARTDAAVLLVHGRADQQTPAWHSERIMKARPERTELVLVDGAGHIDVAGSPRTRLAERTSKWFSEHLGT